MEFPDNVDITPNSRVYGAFRNLSYTFCSAIAEYVDNSIQSYEKNKKSLETIEKNFKLKIIITINENSISIEDNSYGVSVDDFERAFKLAERPKTKGLSEFGLGMKTASFWLCDEWSIKSKALESKKSFELYFKNKEIIEKNIGEIKPYYIEKNEKEHFTIIQLRNVRHVNPKTLKISEDKIKELKKFLTSTYRHYLRKDLLELEIIKGKKVSKPKFQDIKILNATKAPKYDFDSKRTWKKEISFSLNSGKKVSGFVALREIGNPDSGFVFLRHNRVVEGALKGVKYKKIQSSDNKQESRRIFGELDLTEFEVSHTKDKVLMSHEEEEFILKLKEEIGSEFLKQAKNYLVKKDNEINNPKDDSSTDKESENNNHSNSKDSESSNNTNPNSNESEKITLNIQIPRENNMSVGGKISAYAKEMSIVYREMYEVENMLRALIIYIEKKNNLNFMIKYNDKIEKNKKEEEKNGWLPIRGNHGIYYLDFIEIKLIVDDKNWNFFAKYFPGKPWISQRLIDLYKYRNLIAHNSYLNQSERNRVKTYTNEIKSQLLSYFNFN